MESRLLCFAALVALSSAATWMGRLPQKPKELAHMEGCYIQEINDVIPFGREIALAGHCYGIECSRHMIYYNSCGVVGTDDPKCFVSDQDTSRPYPECCPEVNCDIDNNI